MNIKVIFQTKTLSEMNSLQKCFTLNIMGPSTWLLHHFISGEISFQNVIRNFDVRIERNCNGVFSVGLFDLFSGREKQDSKAGEVFSASSDQR